MQLRSHKLTFVQNVGGSNLLIYLVCTEETAVADIIEILFFFEDPSNIGDARLETHVVQDAAPVFP